MASPDNEQILLGYCRKGTPQDEAMRRIFPEASTDVETAETRKIIRATLRVERPPGAETRQFEIKRVLSEDWIVSEVPFDRDGN
jgi:hypothetical protein